MPGQGLPLVSSYCWLELMEKVEIWQEHLSLSVNNSDWSGIKRKFYEIVW